MELKKNKKQKTFVKRSIEAFYKAGRSLTYSTPILFGVIILVGLSQELIPKTWYSTLFSGSIFDTLTASSLGSVLAGNPITSYILGGELLKQGISLIAVTAFLVAWVTVGLVQLPAEALMLGEKFSITRNILAFLGAIIVALVTVGVISLL